MAGKNRAVSPLSNDDSYYSDDFEDDDAHNNTRYKTRSPLLRTDRSNRSNRGRGRGGRFGRGSQMTTGRSSQEPKFDNIAKRVMSARRLKINELKNNNEELNQQIRDLKDENKLLKKTQLRTEKALQRFEDKESDLPQIMQRQQNEVRTYKDQIRKWREKYEKTDRYLRDAEDELEKVKFKLKKLKSVAEEKELPERSELNKRLNKSELDIEERDVKIKELERHLQNIQKNHRHELGIERARQKDTNKKMMELRDENEKMEIVIKEKEKELQMKNIYANRMIKPPHHLPNSYNGTPTPPVKQRRPSLSEGMTPREKAKMMEEKRREDLRKQREAKERNRPRPSHQSNLSDRALRRQLSVERSPLRDDKENTSPRSTQTEQQHKLKREKELRKRQEEEDLERECREAEERERRAWEDKERQLEEEARREADDRRNREERERMKRDAEEREKQERIRRERDEQDRREREWKEKQEREKRERREKEERERREKERIEQERRAREEQERIENDEDFQAGKRKKEEILQKLREIDEGVTKDDKKRNDHVFITSPRENSMDSQSSKKSYTFSRPTENLHKGKPSHKELDYPGSPTRKKKDSSRRYDIDGLEKGGYNPTFTSDKGASKTNNLSLFDDTSTTTNTNKTGKKSKLLEDLFGSKDESDSKQNISFDSKPSKTAAKSSTRSGFPWDDEVSQNKDFGTKRENSSTLFGGGSALINDEEFQPSSRTTNLRRPKQTTTTFHNRPIVTAIDHGFDDDELEEVIL